MSPVTCAIHAYVKVKQSLYRPWEFQKGEAGSQILRQSAYEGGKAVTPTHRQPLTPRKYSWYSFLLEVESTPCDSTVERIMLMKNSSDTIGNRTRDLPVCSAVPQPNAPPDLIYTNSTFCPHSVFMCLYGPENYYFSIQHNWLVFITQTLCVGAVRTGSLYMIPGSRNLPKKFSVRLPSEG
jgi:hypothetical protein